MGILDTIGRAGKAIYRSGVLPEMARGALVAAANPTRGAVGTAGDIFGAIGAVDDDRQARMERQRQLQMQELEIRRKMEDDAREAALNEARIAEAKARTEYQQRRGTQQAGKGVPPTKLAMYKEAFDYYKQRGLSDEDAHVEARSIALGTPSPELYNKRTPSTDAAQMNRELERYRNSPELQSQFKTFDEYYRSIGIGASKADTAGQLTTAKKKAEIPFLVRRPIAGDQEYYSQDVTLNPQGTGVETKYTPTGVKTRQPAPRQPGPSDERMARDRDISRILNRVLKEDTSGQPEYALRNVLGKSYVNDPEVQKYRAEIIQRLQKLVEGKATSKKAEVTISKEDATLQRKREALKAKPAPADPLGAR